MLIKYSRQDIWKIFLLFFFNFINSFVEWDNGHHFLNMFVNLLLDFFLTDNNIYTQIHTGFKQVFDLTSKLPKIGFQHLFITTHKVSYLPLKYQIQFGMHILKSNLFQNKTQRKCMIIVKVVERLMSYTIWLVGKIVDTIYTAFWGVYYETCDDTSNIIDITLAHSHW